MKCRCSPEVLGFYPPWFAALVPNNSVGYPEMGSAPDHNTLESLLPSGVQVLDLGCWFQLIVEAFGKIKRVDWVLMTEGSSSPLV